LYRTVQTSFVKFPAVDITVVESVLFRQLILKSLYKLAAVRVRFEMIGENRKMSYDLEKATRHIVHDYAYLVAAGNGTQRSLAHPFNHYAERTFLVHCRAFAGFFSNGTDGRDMYARDFIDGELIPTLGAWSWHTHIDQHLMHLSKARIDNTREWTGSDNKAILEGFQATWREFYKKLKPSVRPQFDAQIEVHQKQFPDVPLR
jgi:hypothetical protein